MRGCVLATAFAVALVIMGCEKEFARSRVHGVVKYQGKALTNATVMFLGQDSQVYRAELKADGSYEVSGVPQGPIRVAIQQGQPYVPPRADPTKSAAKASVNDEKANAPRADPPPSNVRQNAVQIPAKYGEADKSGLTFDLKEAEQEWSIDLK